MATRPNALDKEAPGASVLVLGGGVTGLLAALRLKRAGRAVEVWEASAESGGWARTLAWPGPDGTPGYLERGPQGLLVGRDGPLERLVRDLGLTLRRQEIKGPRWLGKDGRLHPNPASLRGLLAAPGLGPLDKLRLLGEPFIPCRPNTTEDLEAYITRRLGPAFAREILPALVAGVLAAPPDRIGVEALPRLLRMEAAGGLLRGGLAQGPLRTRYPQDGPYPGTGALTRALARHLGCVRTDRAAESLEPAEGGRWRVRTRGFAREVDTVVLAVPAAAASRLLQPVAPRAATALLAIPHADLRVWHSRHAPVRGWEHGVGLLIHPPQGRGVLGLVSMAREDPRAVPGLLQVRTYLGGAWPVDPALDAWPGVHAELRRWLPDLGPAVQVREERAPAAFPILGRGHAARTGRILADLPRGLHWLGSARFGPGLPDLAEGVEAWASSWA